MIRRYGLYSATLVSNQIEALLAIGDWDEAERLSAVALRGITSSFPYWLLVIRAGVEIGRGEFDAARAHLKAARATLRGMAAGLVLAPRFWRKRRALEARWTPDLARIERLLIDPARLKREA